MKLNYPVDPKSPISQYFGKTKWASNYSGFGLIGHNGIDFAVPIGTNVVAVDAGIVERAQNDPGGYGLYIRVRHSWGISLYAHLSRFNVTVNDKVLPGQTIAYSGNTGNSTGPHLHFEIRPNNEPKDNGYAGAVDPMPFITGEVVMPEPKPKIEIHAAKKVRVKPGYRINVRNKPTVQGDILDVAPGGRELEPLGLIEQDGFIWMKVAVYIAAGNHNDQWVDVIG